MGRQQRNRHPANRLAPSARRGCAGHELQLPPQRPGFDGTRPGTAARASAAGTELPAPELIAVPVPAARPARLPRAVAGIPAGAQWLPSRALPLPLGRNDRTCAHGAPSMQGSACT
jgi:hypothetical protein